MNAPLPVEPRLIAGSVRNDDTGCLIWVRSKNSRGYGLIGVNGRVELVHRMAHEQWIGPIPDGFQVDHVLANGCLSRLCIEPNHLEAVTPLENNLRKPGVHKTHCIRNHPQTPENVRVSQRGYRSCRVCQNEVHNPKWNALRVTQRKTASQLPMLARGGQTAENSGDHSVSLAHNSARRQKQKRLDRPATSPREQAS